MRLNRRRKIGYPVFATFPKPPGRRKRKVHWKFWLTGGFFIFLLAGGFYLLAFSPFFQIRKIEITGWRILSEEAIKSVVQSYLQTQILKVIPQRNLPFLWSENLKYKLEETFAEIGEIRIEKIIPETLRIFVIEREAAAFWCQTQSLAAFRPATTTPSVLAAATSTVPLVSPLEKRTLPEAENCFLADSGGLLYRQVPAMTGGLAPAFYSQDGGLKEKVLDNSQVVFAQEIKELLRPSEIELVGFWSQGKGSRDLTSLTSQGWLIYFDVSRPAALQAKILTTLLVDEIQEKRKELEYIDLRIANRAYYKFYQP